MTENTLVWILLLMQGENPHFKNVTIDEMEQNVQFYELKQKSIVN